MGSYVSGADQGNSKTGGGGIVINIAVRTQLCAISTRWWVGGWGTERWREDGWVPRERERGRDKVTSSFLNRNVTI